MFMGEDSFRLVGAVLGSARTLAELNSFCQENIRLKSIFAENM
jgi:hypothetical protein